MKSLKTPPLFTQMDFTNITAIVALVATNRPSLIGSNFGHCHPFLRPIPKPQAFTTHTPSPFLHFDLFVRGHRYNISLKIDY